MNLVDIYNEFNNLDPANKFYFSLFIGIALFLYKTFLNMYSEDGKQSQTIKLKAGEYIAKLDASLAIYEGSDKDRHAQDKLIEKMSECYLFLDFKIRKKIRLYYLNRSESSLTTLKKVITEIMDSFETLGEKQLLIDQLISFANRLIKPFGPLVVVTISIIVASVNYSQFVKSNTIWDKIVLMSNYTTFIISVLIGFGLLNIFIENRKKIYNPGLRFWICTIGIIVSPWIVYAVSRDHLYISLALQVLCFICIIRINSNEHRETPHPEPA